MGDFWYNKYGIIEKEIDMQKKKVLIVLLLKILENHSDEEHPFTQTKLAELISDMLLPCDRKTIGRNIKSLIEMGYPIRKTKKGFYLAGKKFSNEEKDFVLNAVRSAVGKTKEEKEDILNRLSDVLIKIYR